MPIFQGSILYNAVQNDFVNPKFRSLSHLTTGDVPAQWTCGTAARLLLAQVWHLAELCTFLHRRKLVSFVHGACLNRPCLDTSTQWKIADKQKSTLVLLSQAAKKEMAGYKNKVPAGRKHLFQHTATCTALLYVSKHADVANSIYSSPLIHPAGKNGSSVHRTLPAQTAMNMDCRHTIHTIAHCLSPYCKKSQFPLSVTCKNWKCDINNDKNWCAVWADNGMVSCEASPPSFETWSSVAWLPCCSNKSLLTTWTTSEYYMPDNMVQFAALCDRGRAVALSVSCIVYWFYLVMTAPSTNAGFQGISKKQKKKKNFPGQPKAFHTEYSRAALAQTWTAGLIAYAVHIFSRLSVFRAEPRWVTRGNTVTKVWKNTFIRRYIKAD